MLKAQSLLDLSCLICFQTERNFHPPSSYSPLYIFVLHSAIIIQFHAFNWDSFWRICQRAYAPVSSISANLTDNKKKKKLLLLIFTKRLTIFNHNPFTIVSTTIRKPRSRHSTAQILVWFCKAKCQTHWCVFPTSPVDNFSPLVFWDVTYTYFPLFPQLASQDFVHFQNFSWMWFSWLIT